MRPTRSRPNSPERCSSVLDPSAASERSTLLNIFYKESFGTVTSLLAPHSGFPPSEATRNARLHGPIDGSSSCWIQGCLRWLIDCTSVSVSSSLASSCRPPCGRRTRSSLSELWPVYSEQAAWRLRAQRKPLRALRMAGGVVT